MVNGSRRSDGGGHGSCVNRDGGGDGNNGRRAHGVGGGAGENAGATNGRGQPYVIAPYFVN